jgi:hypothetical protein
VKKIKKIVAGFVVFNCLSFAVFAACDATMTINGESCSYTGLHNDYCWYSCPSGSGGFKKPKSGESEFEEIAF